MIYELPATSRLHMTGWHVLSPFGNKPELQEHVVVGEPQPIDAPRFVPAGSSKPCGEDSMSSTCWTYLADRS